MTTTLPGRPPEARHRRLPLRSATVAAMLGFVGSLGHAYYTTNVPARTLHPHDAWLRADGPVGMAYGTIAGLAVCVAFSLHISGRREQTTSTRAALRPAAVSLSWAVMACAAATFHTGFVWKGGLGTATWLACVGFLSVSVPPRCVASRLTQRLADRRRTLGRVFTAVRAVTPYAVAMTGTRRWRAEAYLVRPLPGHTASFVACVAHAMDCVVAEQAAKALLLRHVRRRDTECKRFSVLLQGCSDRRSYALLSLLRRAADALQTLATPLCLALAALLLAHVWASTAMPVLTVTEQIGASLVWLGGVAACMTLLWPRA